jgi:heat shock protein HtpX
LSSQIPPSAAVSPEALNTRNMRQTVFLGFGFGLAVFLVFAVILLLLGGGIAGLIIAFLVAAIWTGFAWVRASEAVLDLSEVQAADEKRHARLFNAASNTCASVGVAAPTLYVVEDPALNAMVVGRDARNASLVVTTGLLDELGVVELEAVITQELLRVKLGDIGPQTFIVATIGAGALLAESADRWPSLQKILMVPMPLLERVLLWLHTDRRDIDLDLATSGITRYPPGLADALEKMDGRSALAMGAPVTAHLWIAPPLGFSAPTALARIHVPLAERVAVLREL